MCWLSQLETNNKKSKIGAFLARYDLVDVFYFFFQNIINL